MKKLLFTIALGTGFLAYGSSGTEKEQEIESKLKNDIMTIVNKVNPIDQTTGQRKYISFGFISDIHKCKRVENDDANENPVTDYWYGSAGILTEAEQTIRLLGSVASDAGLDAIINGGDLSTAPVMGPAKELTEVEYTNEIWNVKAMFDQYVPSSVPLFTVDGNHERNYGSNMHMTDDAWAYVLTNFNTSASVAHAQGVDVTYHRDLANATLGNSQKGRFAGNSYHLDFRRLSATKGVNVRIACLSAYDNASGSDLRNRVFDAGQFYDDGGNQLSSGMTPENTIMGMIAHGAEEKVGVSARSAAGTMQCGYMNSYSNPSAKTGPWNGGSHKGLGFFGLVAAHYHFVTTKEITDAFDNLVNADNKVYASVVSVASAHATNWPAKPNSHELGTEAAYHFSIFVIDTDHNLMREVRLGGWTSNPVVHENPVVQLHDFNIRTQLGATNPPEEEEDPPEEEPGDDDDDPVVPPQAAADDLSNYKWAVIGDSLSDPKLENTTDGPFKYYHYLQQTSCIKCVYTNAVGGTGYKNGYNKSADKLADGGCFYQRLGAHPIPADVDVVTFFGSINDGGFAETDEDLGTATDSLSEKSTLAAYMNKAIDLARTQAPNAKIVLIGGIFFDASHATGHVRLNDMLRQIAAARKLNGDANIVFYDWLTEDPDDPLDFHQITVNRSEEGCFGSLYTYDWKTRGKINESFGHPNPLYNEIWLAPHFGEVLAAELKATLGEVTTTPESNACAIASSVVSLGTTDATAADVYLAYGTDANNLGAAAKIKSGLPLDASVTYTIENLEPGTEYFFELSVTNNAAVPAGNVKKGSFVTRRQTSTVGELGDFAKKVVFTVKAGGMPALVKISSAIEGFRYSDCNADGSDIRFADAEDNAVPFEFEEWDPSGVSLVWVKVPAAVGATTITMYYSGTPSVANTPSDVWSAYTGVWHFDTLGTDSTANSQGSYANSTAVEGLDGHLSTYSVPDEAGVIGKAFKVNDSKPGYHQAGYEYGGMWVVDSGEDSPLDANGVFTVSGWFKHNGGFVYNNVLAKRKDNGNSEDPKGAFFVRMHEQGNDPTVQAYGSSGSVELSAASEQKANMVDNWVYLTFVYDGKSLSIYENGELCKSGTITAATDNDAPLVFGNGTAVADGAAGNAWRGWIDEARYSAGVAMTAAQVATEYAAMANASFVSAGSAQNVDGSEVPTDPTDPTDPDDPTPTDPDDPTPTDPDDPDDPPQPPSGDGILPGATPAETRQMIQDAIDAAAPTRGTVMLAAGLFEINVELFVTNGVTLVGQGWTNTVIKQVTAEKGNETHRVITIKGGSTLSGVTVTGGNSDQNNAAGAGVMISDSGNVTWCCVKENYTKRNYGGGIYVADGGGVTVIDHTIVSGNIAGSSLMDGAGGGIAIRGKTGCQVVIDACLVCGNTAGGSGRTSPGGGIALIEKNSDNASVTVRNTTVVGNAVVGNGVGGGVYAGKKSVTLVNCLIAENTSEATAVYGNADVAYKAENLAPAVTTCVIAPMSAGFVGDGDYHLAAGSPAIGAGTAWEGIGNDLDNKAFAATPSVGCYEYGSVPPHEEWDIPGTKGGINGIDDGEGHKIVSFNAISLVDGALTVGFEAAKVDANGETFGLVCKENLTDAETFTINATLTDDESGTATLGTLSGLTDKTSLFVLGIGPAARDRST